MDDDEIPCVLNIAYSFLPVGLLCVFSSTLVEIETLPVPEQKVQTVPLTIISGFLGAGKSTLIRSVRLHAFSYNCDA